MAQLLVTVILMEAALLLALFFKSHLRKHVMMALDCVKQGRGPVIVRTVEGTFLAVFFTNIYSILKIRHHSIDSGSANPSDQVLLAENMLEASLTGFLLFLSMVIEILHHLIREQGSLEKILKAEAKELEMRKFCIAQQLKALWIQVSTLKAKINELEFECQTKRNKAEAAEASVLALKTQAEEFHLEYDHLLEYNQNLRNQLQSIDQRLLEDNQETIWSNVKSNILCDGLIQYPWGIQTPGKSSRVVVSRDEVETTNRCDQHLLYGSHATSWPRHRRPIYQH